ncbi:hypothetical protein NFI96_029453 [Prochilodus magdalenae]|nr:hypothetical protein NFI96_029453 [Prochilodus magdalenae]
MIYIKDQLTALHKDEKILTLRDVFKGDLKHKIVYNKAGSTGNKEKTVNGNEVEMSELDEGQSYCFKIAAYIPSRKGQKKQGPWSETKCSPAGNRNIIEEYGLWVVGSAILVMVTLLVILFILILACCKRTQKGKQAEDKEVITQV